MSKSKKPDKKNKHKEVDPEKDYRNWRYPWEKAWRDGLKVKW